MSEHVFPCRGLEKRERASGLGAVFLGLRHHVLLRRLPLGAWDWVLIVRAICVVLCGVVCTSLVGPDPAFPTLPRWLNQNLNGVSTGRVGDSLGLKVSVSGSVDTWGLFLPPCTLVVVSR